MFERTIALIGDNNFNNITNKHIAIIGVGGVGGYVAEMLTRCGIGEITICDFDVIEESNINRQIIATTKTIGKLKVNVLEERLKSINPNIIINVFSIKLDENTIDLIINSKIDYVVDAIDDIKNKTLLIKHCYNNKIKIISAMGAGNRIDIPDFKVMDIYKTSNDGLAKVMRKNLRQLNINNLDVVCCSTLAQKNGEIVGSIAYYPAMCGCVISAYVINKLIENNC